MLQDQFQELKTDVHIIPTEWHAKLHNMVDERMSLTSLRTVPKGNRRLDQRLYRPSTRLEVYAKLLTDTTLSLPFQFSLP